MSTAIAQSGAATSEAVRELGATLAALMRDGVSTAVSAGASGLRDAAAVMSSAIDRSADSTAAALRALNLNVVLPPPQAAPVLPPVPVVVEVVMPRQEPPPPPPVVERVVTPTPPTPPTPPPPVQAPRAETPPHRYAPVAVHPTPKRFVAETGVQADVRVRASYSSSDDSSLSADSVDGLQPPPPMPRCVTVRCRYAVVCLCRAVAVLWGSCVM